MFPNFFAVENLPLTEQSMRSNIGFMKKLMVAFATTVAAVFGLIAFPSPASAADGWVYVVVNDRVCGSPGVKVRGILANVRETGWTTSKWDNGDNIVYPKVRLGRNNLFTAQIRCEKKVAYFWWTTVGYRTISYTIKPTKHKQTIWVG